jgi:hypothetical protein
MAAEAAAEEAAAMAAEAAADTGAAAAEEAADTSEEDINTSSIFFLFSLPFRRMKIGQSFFLSNLARLLAGFLHFSGVFIDSIR